jgi:hypothetical protein
MFEWDSVFARHGKFDRIAIKGHRRKSIERGGAAVI